jgi:hypothetical protein
MTAAQCSGTRVPVTEPGDERLSTSVQRSPEEFTASQTSQEAKSQQQNFAIVRELGGGTCIHHTRPRNRLVEQHVACRPLSDQSVKSVSAAPAVSERSTWSRSVEMEEFSPIWLAQR